MHSESLLKHIKQGARDGIPVLRRSTLTLGQTNSDDIVAGSKTTGAEESGTVQSPSSPESSPLPSLPVAAPSSTAISTFHHIGFDFALFERLRACAPELALLTEAEVAALLRVSLKKLQHDRYTKKGLKFLKFNGVIRYRLSTVLAKLAEG